MSLFRRCVWLLAAAAVLAASAVAAPQPPSPGEVDMDPYDVLGVDRDASQEDIRRAFRRLSVKLHPDKVQAAAAARAANKQATAATAATAASAAAAAAAAAADAADAADAASSDATADAPTTPPAATVPATPASSSVGKGGEQPVDLAAAEAFKRIVAAYDLIGDSSSRALYDGMGGKGFQTREEFESAQAESGRTTRDMYSGSSAVASLSLATFHAADSAAQPVLVKFFAPWCSHCQDLAPEFKRAAILLEDDATVGAVDCDVHHALCHEQRISRFPTVRLFPHGPARGGAVEFQGPVHEAEQLVEFVNGIVHTKLQTVTEATFHSQVLRDDSHLWLLVFGAPWCGPCGALAPMVRDVANTLHPVVQVGAVDCDAEVQWCGRMNVQRYPTARLFSFRSEDKAHEFNGMGKELLLPPSNMPHWHILSVVKDVFGVAFSRELSAGEPGGDANADEDLDGDVALDVDAFADVQGGDDAM